MSASTEELKLQIETATQVPQYMWKRINKADEAPTYLYGVKSLIRQWLVSQGVSERKALQSGEVALNNAFAIGDLYVRTMLDDGPKRKPRGGGLDLTTETNDLLDSPLRDYDRPREIYGEKVEKPSGDVPYNAFARAADAIIRPRLDVIRKEIKMDIEAGTAANRAELTRYVGIKLGEAIEQTKLSDKLRSEVTNLVVQIAAETVEKLAPRRIEIKKNNKTIQLPAELRHKAFDECLEWLLMGKNICMIGEAGTGKTHMFPQLADAIGKKYYPIGQSLSKYDLAGYTSPTGEYIAALFYEPVKNGGLVGIDEGDMWTAAAFGFLNQPIANRYCSFPNGVVEVHPDFQVIVSMNTFGNGATLKYQGRNQMDAATMDRFIFMQIGYDEDLETVLYGNGPWVRYVHRVRKAIEDQKNLNHVISMRAIANCVEAAAQGMDPDRIAKSCLWRELAPDTVAKIKNQAGEPPRLRLIEDEDEDIGEVA